MRQRRTRTKRSGGVLAVLVACALCAGIAVAFVDTARSSPVPSAGASPTAPSRDQTTSTTTPAVTFSPAPGATGVALDSTIVVKATGGTLFSVHVTTASGWPIAGLLSASDQWRSGGTLLAGTDYKIDAVTLDATGARTSTSSTFRTLTPGGDVGATLFPDGVTVGVAQPVVVKFDHRITNPLSRAAVVSHFTITESKPVSGGWHWFSNKELHFRPTSFWPAGESVDVTSDLSGWSAGDGLWGAGQVHVHFDVGDAHIAVANLSTDIMTVSNNGKIIAIYPFSGGKTTDPTMNGVHIVLDRESVVRMISSSNGVPVNSPDGYDELVYSDVHITDSGEYVHAAPWSVRSQGHVNVSHGCVNLSDANAAQFFAMSRVGDVVIVTGGPRPPAPGDHGVMDWDSAPSDWTPGAVHGPAVAPPSASAAPVRAG